MLAAAARASTPSDSSQSLLSVDDWKALVRHNAASNPHATFDEDDLTGFQSLRAASAVAAGPATGAQGMASDEA